MIGFKVFDNRELYKSMGSDCGLLIASVFASRNCNERRKKQGFVKNEQDIFYVYFSQPFKYIFILSIFTFSIFSKLSFSMFVNIALIGFYEVYVCFYFKLSGVINYKETVEGLHSGDKLRPVR